MCVHCVLKWPYNVKSINLVHDPDLNINPLTSLQVLDRFAKIIKNMNVYGVHLSRVSKAHNP